MQMSKHGAIVLAALVVASLGCNAAFDPAPPIATSPPVAGAAGATESSSETATEAPAPAQTCADAPPADRLVFRLDDAINGGYCFFYPADFANENNLGHGVISIHGPQYGSGPEPDLAWLNIYADDPAGLTLDAYVQKRAADTLGGVPPDFPLTQTAITLGGLPAVLVDGMPGRLASRTIFVMDGSAVFVLIFSPNESTALPEVTADMQRLYDAVTTSWVFLP